MASYAVNDDAKATIHYEVHAGLAKETVLFIHGNLASNRWWYPAHQFWQQSAKGQNYTGSLIYAEFRGCGFSSAPTKDSDVDMHLFADDFIGLVRSLNIGPIHLVGHSTGGLIVPLMLAKAPELFKKAILLDPVGAQGVTFDPKMIGAFEQMKVDKDLVAVILGATIHGNNPENVYFNSVVVEDAFKAVKSVGHLVLKAIDQFDAREEVAKITHSVLVLHGEHDQLLSVEESRKMAALIRNAEFRILKGQGHCMNVEAPEKFVKLAQDFLF
ncbi:MAG: alpha/beta hydrolase [Bdellovibrionaceae bacterium]|nr:alpha/beta hydrolase [Pseudobdellovibrionaceae bacterium]